MSPKTHRKAMLPKKWNRPPCMNMDVKIVAQVGTADSISTALIPKPKVVNDLPELNSSGMKPHLRKKTNASALLPPHRYPLPASWRA